MLWYSELRATLSRDVVLAFRNLDDLFLSLFPELHDSYLGFDAWVGGGGDAVNENENGFRKDYAPQQALAQFLNDHIGAPLVLVSPAMYEVT